MEKNTKKNVQTGLEIAVIGMAGRFPGARNIDEFWDNLKNGIESVTFYTEEELKNEGLDPVMLTNPNYVLSGGGILEDADCFDALFFGYTPIEAGIMDPQSRILHECAWEALEDAGYNPNSYDRMIGIYTGASNNPLWEISILLSGKDKNVGEFNSRILSNKELLNVWISYKLNLKGPAVEINTTCSTSLVAIHIACRALWTKECDIALAGGGAIKTFNKSGYLYQEGMIRSSDGHCRAFDAKATGTVNGNGAGIVVLKKLKEAINDRDNIYAVIKGTAINNDGIRKAGFTAPSIEGQSDAIKLALHISGIEPESIGYVETHGTGTIIGDPIEIEALTLAFNTAKKNYCAIGSVKTNIGHLDTAAGVTGFIKTVLALKNRQIPPSLHFQTPNPKIDFRNSPFFVNKELREWKNSDGFPLRAGVSSFGIGGTNAHAVLEEYPINEDREPFDNSYYLLPLSARSQHALDKMTENLAGYLRKNTGINLADVSYTLSMGRDVFEYKKTIVCTDLNDAVAALVSTNTDKVQIFHTREKDRPVVFMFPGQGAQYVNMGLGLYNQEPVFRQEMDQCFEILKSLVNFDLKEILYPRNENSEQGIINRTDVTQPAIFCFEYALARLLMSWGIKPYSMIGHSIGEYTAACLSGVFSLAEVLKLMVLRGRLMQGMSPGMMLSVSLSENELKSLLNPEISLAAVNSTSSCVISGAPDAVEKFESRLKEMGHTTRRLHTSHAFHSAMMDPILTEFEEKVKQTPLDKPIIPFISNVTGHWISMEKATSPMYWAKHLRATVNFRDGLSRLLENKKAIFIEVGPGNVLSAFLRRHKDKKADHFVINMARHPHENIPDECYLSSKMGQLWLYGVNIDWAGFYSHEKRYRISLPTYPFERQRFHFHVDRVLKRLLNGEGSNASSLKENGDELKERVIVLEKESPILYSRPELTKPYAAPRTEIERKLANLWQDFFGIQNIGIDDNFFELGGDSLKAITIIAGIHRELRVKITLPEIFKHSTIGLLAEYMAGVEKTIFVGIEAVEKKEYYLLSAAQKRLYILHCFEVMSTAYNMPYMLSLEGTINIDKLAESFRKLISRHESLRTSFEVINEEPVQRVHRQVEFEIEQIGKKSFIRPFDLSRAPLLRVGLLQETETKYLLVIDMHHIITDGTSQLILVKDFLSLYHGQEMFPLKRQYKEYSEWRQSREMQDALKVQEAYWLKEFEEQIPLLNLPTDYPRPPVQSFEGNTMGFELNAVETGRLNEMAYHGGATLFMVILAIYNIFLAKLSSGEDIVVGVAVAGRRHADLEKIVGMFVNTLALRNYPSGEKTFTEFLIEIKEKSLNAFENQDYQFEELVEKTTVERDMGRNPIFDTMFIFQNIFDETGRGAIPGEEIAGLKVKPQHYKQNTSIFDLSLIAIKKGEGLWLSFEYCTKLFREETILRFIGYFKKILWSVLEGPGKKIADIEIATEEEKAKILYEFNDTGVSYPESKTIHQLFAEQVEKSPDSIAVVGADLRVCPRPVQPVQLVQLTYLQLNEQSGRLARLLIEKGVQVDNIVGIMVERSVEMIVGIMGIIKSGGAYLPIDPEYPQERIDYMLKDSNAAILLTDEKKTDNCQLSMREYPHRRLQHSAFDLPRIQHSNHLAYVIYTSGSTGKPKGVAIAHRNAVNFFKGMTDRIDFSPRRIVLAVTTLSFDIFLLETLLPVTAGLRVVIADEAQQKDPGALWEVIGKHGVNLLQMTPSRLKLLLSQSDNGYLNKIEDLLVGGEAFPVDLFEELKKKYRGTIINVYGPTETTVWSTLKDLTGQTGINIGTPIANTQVYIIDKFKRLLPIGVAGEMFIGGHGVAFGYLNNPELTSEKFFIFHHSSFIIHHSNLYRTGDQARWLPDGNIEFLGRSDYQVKIRGYRVELEEINNRLFDCHDIDDAVVIARENTAGEKYLCAYVSSKKKLVIPQLKSILAGTLPGYMIPSHFIQVEKIPLTVSGKIDRKALLSIGLQAGVEPDFILPRTEVEKKIAETWEKLLGLEKVGVNQNFFDLGGTSLDIIRLNVKFREIFNEAETIVQMFRYPTIRSFAEYLSRGKGAIAADNNVISPGRVNIIKQARQNQKNKRRSLK